MKELDSGKRKQLEKIGVVWNVQKQQWENYFTLPVEYKDREGDCNVPNRHKEDREKLGSWLSDQRKAMKKGRLNVDKQKQLEKIGVAWDMINQQWENYYNLFVKFKKREGNCNVPAIHKEDGKNLGMLLGDQCQAKKKENLMVRKKKPEIQELFGIY